MKAIICEGYGPPDVLRIRERPKPAPADNEVLIRMRATTVSSGDWRVRSLAMPRGFGLLARPALGFRAPRQPILGTELAGDVVAVGNAVTSFKAGDRVFAFPGGAMGAYAEYTCMPADGAVAPMPSNLDYGQAAALSFGGSTIWISSGGERFDGVIACSSMALRVPWARRRCNWPDTSVPMSPASAARPTLSWSDRSVPNR